MVAILVLLTFIILVAAAWIMTFGRVTATEGVEADAGLRAPPIPEPESLSGAPSYLHPGHVWVRLAPDGIAMAGASEFASNFVGSLARVEAPEEGTELRQGEPAWTLVSGKDRRLTQAMPLDGTIVAVNRAIADRRAGTSPRKGDWILAIRPARLAENIQNLIGGSLADAWQEAATLRMNAALAPAIGRVANDGGVWLENFGDLLDESDWQKLREGLFPPQQGVIVH
ncbi:MAG: glycine cleavage system protein H [Bacteroidota bacterium]